MPSCKYLGIFFKYFLGWKNPVFRAVLELFSGLAVAVIPDPGE
jgi:hypothetical protein